MARGCRCGASYRADTAMRGVRWCPHCDTPCPLRPCPKCKAIDVKAGTVAIDERAPRLEPPTD